MDICSGQVKYLIAIAELSKRCKNVRGVDVSKYLGVTRPSVTKMLKCLANSQLIDESFSYGIKFTKQGKEVSEMLYKQYQYIYVFFFNMIKLPEDKAKSQSLEFVSTFPTETSEKFCYIIKNTIKNRKKSEVSSS
ncbi:MAG: metal-dependent transcriptional regulator [Oscillospiraceae bacterium]